MFVDEHRERFRVEPICGTLEVSVFAYYQRAKGKPSARALEDQRLLTEIRAVHADNYEAYSSRRTWKELRRRGERVVRCTVERLMRQHGIQAPSAIGEPSVVPTSSSATSPRSVPMNCGWRTSRTCALGREWSSSPS